MADQLIYLDVCVLSRPFDNQRQPRIRIETAALELILDHIRLKHLKLVVSPVHKAEISAIRIIDERQHLLHLLNELGIVLLTDSDSIRGRAEQLVDSGMGIADAAHVAYAEATQADFVTVDDRLLKQCHRVNLSIWSGTPQAFCDKEQLR